MPKFVCARRAHCLSADGCASARPHEYNTAFDSAGMCYDYRDAQGTIALTAWGVPEAMMPETKTIGAKSK